MWASKNRARYDRSKLRYPSDLTDYEERSERQSTLTKSWNKN